MGDMRMAYEWRHTFPPFAFAGLTNCNSEGGISFLPIAGLSQHARGMIDHNIAPCTWHPQSREREEKMIW